VTAAAIPKERVRPAAISMNDTVKMKTRARDTNEIAQPIMLDFPLSIDPPSKKF
jgi:hypothetical protein